MQQRIPAYACTNCSTTSGREHGSVPIAAPGRACFNVPPTSEVGPPPKRLPARPSHTSSDRETFSLMSTPEPAGAHPSLPRIHDRAMWAAAQQLITDHLCVPTGGRCFTPTCAPGYPCTAARVAARLRAASMGPFHQRITALVDARSCEVPPLTLSGLMKPGASNTKLRNARPEPARIFAPDVLVASV